MLKAFEISPNPLSVLVRHPQPFEICDQNATNHGRMGANDECQRIGRDNYAHPHRLRDCAYGDNGTRGLLFSWLAPAGRDHAAAKVG